MKKEKLYDPSEIILSHSVSLYLTCRNSAFKEKENPRVNKGFLQLLSKTQISLKVYLSQLYIAWMSSNGLFEINCNSTSL